MPKETKEERAKSLQREANKRYIAKKAAKQQAAAMEEALQLPQSNSIVDPEKFENPPFSSDELTHVEETIIDEEDFDQYAPPPNVKVQVVGGPDLMWEKLEQATIAKRLQSENNPVLVACAAQEGVIDQPVADGSIDTQEEHLGDVEALEQEESLQSNKSILPEFWERTITDLINSLNYLYNKSKNLRAHDKPILMSHVKKARKLISDLKEL